MSVATVRILGLDPGIGTTGFGVIERSARGVTHVAHGVIRTTPGEPMELRLLTLGDDLAELLRRYAPTEAAVEQLFFARNTTTAMSVSQARGVLLLELARAGVAVSELTPPQVKAAVGGWGSARKAEVQEMVRRLLRLERRPTPDDAADALAIALAYAARRRHARLPRRPTRGA